MSYRVGMFILTNIAVLAVLAIVSGFLGLPGDSYQALMVFSAIVGFGGSFISLAMSKWLAKRSVGAQVITQPANATEQWLFSTVDRLAGQAGIKMPEVAVYQSPDVNAFATGARKDAALVAVSTGLLQTMPKDEVEAVLGHEVAHIANGDMVTLTLVQGVLNTFVFFLARVIGNIIDRDGRGFGYFAVVMIAQVVLGILASFVVAWVSRQREFRADAGSAQLNGSAPMQRALARLAQGHAGRGELPEQIQAFGISPSIKPKLTKLLMTHPPIEERIAALQQGTYIKS